MGDIVSMGSTRLNTLRNVYKTNLTTAVLLDTNGNNVSSTENVTWDNLAPSTGKLGGVTLSGDVIFDITATTYPVTINRVRYGTGNNTITVNLSTSEQYTEPGGRYALTSSKINHPYGSQ